MLKINLILLASGYSRRFNGNKLLTNFYDKPLYMHIIDKAINMDFNKVICVTQYEEIKRNLNNTGIYVVMNENSELGISNSIKLGINYDKEADGYMFMVCDQPFIRKDTIKNVIDVFETSNKGIAAIGNESIIGNPVIFSRKYIDELLSLKGDTGGKKIVKRHLDDLELIEVNDDLEFIDIDTKEVYERFK